MSSCRIPTTIVGMRQVVHRFQELVHATFVGTAFVVLFQLPRNPKLVVVPAASAPLELRFVAVTPDPLCVRLVLQNWLTVCPFANVQVIRQPLMAAVPAVTFTDAWKPPGHWFTML
jgi:hypothetical protein